jgi:hypothetical protein
MVFLFASGPGPRVFTTNPIVDGTGGTQPHRLATTHRCRGHRLPEDIVDFETPPGINPLTAAQVPFGIAFSGADAILRQQAL